MFDQISMGKGNKDRFRSFSITSLKREKKSDMAVSSEGIRWRQRVGAVFLLHDMERINSFMKKREV